MLHFRQLLVLGLVAGTAILLPHNAFAAKNDTAVPSHTPNAAEPAVTQSQVKSVVLPENTSAKAEPAKSPVEKPKAAPKQANQGQGLATQKPSAGKAAKASPQKSASAVRHVLTKVPAKVDKSRSAIKKAAVVKATVQKAGTAAEQSSKASVGQGNRVNSNKGPEKAGFQPNDVNHSQSMKPIDWDRAIEKESDNTPLQDKAMKPIEQWPRHDGKDPAGSDKLPLADQAVNQIQRTSSNNGSSNDRVSGSSSPTSLTDLWFKWYPYDCLCLIQTYFSRQALFTNQWVNAPPSPPPQEALFLKNVSRS